MAIKKTIKKATKKAKKKYKVGDVIEIPVETKDQIKKMSEEMVKAKCAFSDATIKAEMLGFILGQMHKAFWELIEDYVPESKGLKLTFVRSEQILKVRDEEKKPENRSGK